jgi:hypothetical protein
MSDNDNNNNHHSRAGTVCTGSNNTTGTTTTNGGQKKKMDQDQDQEQVQQVSVSEDWPLLSADHKLSAEEAQRAVEQLRSLLRFKTVSATAASDGEYARCAAWLVEQLSLQCGGCFDRVHLLEESPAHSPVVVARWKGSHVDADTMPVILLNSHYDVVPADPAAWTVPPFEAILRDNKIYGRGAQDMKCV